MGSVIYVQEVYILVVQKSVEKQVLYVYVGSYQLFGGQSFLSFSFHMIVDAIRDPSVNKCVEDSIFVEFFECVVREETFAIRR